MSLLRIRLVGKSMMRVILLVPLMSLEYLSGLVVVDVAGRVRG